MKKYDLASDGLTKTLGSLSLCVKDFKQRFELANKGMRSAELREETTNYIASRRDTFGLKPMEVDNHEDWRCPQLHLVRRCRQRWLARLHARLPFPRRVILRFRIKCAACVAVASRVGERVEMVRGSMLLNMAQKGKLVPQALHGKYQQIHADMLAGGGSDISKFQIFHVGPEHFLKKGAIEGHSVVEAEPRRMEWRSILPSMAHGFDI